MKEIVKNAMRAQLLIIAILINLFFAPSLWAEENSIYEIDIPISKTISNPLQPPTDLFQEAFKALVQRASGSTKIFEKEIFKAELKNIDTAVEQFSYLQPNTPSSRLKVRFNPHRMAAFFRAAEISVLEERPLTLVMWVIEQDKKSEWLLKESHNEISNTLEKLAEERNLPLIYPLLDLKDTQDLNETMVINQEYEPLLLAGKRYAAEKIWVGRLSKQPSGWYGQWTLLGEEDAQRPNWDFSADSMTGLISEALNGLAQNLQSDNADHSEGNAVVGTLELTEHATQNSDEKKPALKVAALSTTEKNTEKKAEGPKKKSRSKEQVLKLKINGALGLEPYTKVMQYLSKLESVSDVAVSSVTAEGTIFDIRTRQDRAELKQALNAASFLTEIESEGQDASSDSSACLKYSIK